MDRFEEPALAGSGGAVAPSASDRRHIRSLFVAVRELSLARSLDNVTAIVRHHARRLSGADGATFVLRDGEQCVCVDEDAIAPLWKGRRFPIQGCVSGWVMRNGRSAAIADIYADARVPIDAYRSTFVKSLAMVPIRKSAPVGAIGCYWARHYVPNDEELWALQALADSTSVALENVALYEQLEARVRERTAQLESANEELEAFSYSVSHDLRNPLSTITLCGSALLDDCAGELNGLGRQYADTIVSAATRMNAIITDLLAFARSSRHPVQREAVDLTGLALELCNRLRQSDPSRRVEVVVESGIVARGDRALLAVAMENLLGNAWKYTRKQPRARIELRVTEHEGERTYVVQDNGAGFDMAHAAKLFIPFERLHRDAEFEGTGIGLCTVQRIVERHGGRIWATSAPRRGATFYFTLGELAAKNAGKAFDAAPVAATQH